MNNFLAITKDIAKKAKKESESKGSQTNLNLVSQFHNNSLDMNLLSDPKINALGSIFTQLLNSFPDLNQMSPRKFTWTESYELSESIIGSRNRLLADPTILKELGLQQKCLYAIFDKFPEIDKSIFKLFTYLNQIYNSTETVLYSKYIGILYGFTCCSRAIMDYENLLFEEKRTKLYDKSGYRASFPKPNSKIDIVEVLEFIKTEFSPISVGFILSHLYEGNNRTSADALGYSTVYFYDILLKKGITSIFI